MATKPVVNIDDLHLVEFGHGTSFGCKLGRAGPIIGARKLGCMLTIVESGKRAFPFHAHHVTEEMFVVLEGEGEYRFGDGRYPIRQGDILAAPSGGPETAHQIINTGSATLRYLSISTMADPEVVEYPDSGKFAVMSQLDETGMPHNARLALIGRREDNALDYWDGENGAKDTK